MKAENTVPPQGGAHNWRVVDTGNFYTEFECTQCHTRTCIAPEDLESIPVPGICPAAHTTVVVESLSDPVNHPNHYTSHPSGIECIQITEHMGFNLGNVVKYAWRCDLKHDAIEDLKKARFYLNREIEKREGKLHDNESIVPR